MNSNETIGSLGGGGTAGGKIDIQGNTLTLGTDNMGNNFLGVVAGSGLIVKTGTGVQVIGGATPASTYTGKWRVDGGTLAIFTEGRWARTRA